MTHYYDDQEWRAPMAPPKEHRQYFQTPQQETTLSSDLLAVSSDPSYVTRMANPDIHAITDEIAVLLTQKRQDYGTANIDKHGKFGILVRISDKVERLNNLMASGKEPNFESINDSFADIAGYAILALEMDKRTK